MKLGYLFSMLLYLITFPISAQEGERSMEEEIRYELITESDSEERVAVPWDEEVFSEISKEGGQMVYSVYSDTVKFAAEIDGEYVWQDYFYRGLTSLYLYRIGDSRSIKIVEENTVTSNPMISTFILTDGEYDMKNIFNNRTFEKIKV